MSNISIEGKNLKDIDQSNFQSVGPYTDRDEVIEPWQGRNKESGSQDTDLRFKLGTYTENNRDYWEIQTVDSRTRRSQFQSEDLKTATAERKDDLVISDEVNWSVDTFPFVTNEDNETIPLYFYYDKELHPTEYNNAIHRKVNLRIELRESGRGTDGIIDNFLLREPYRPFFFGLNKNSYGTDADGILIGGGAYRFDDVVRAEAIPNSISYLERWTDGSDNQTRSTDDIYSFDMPRNDFELVANFRLNPTIKMTSRVNGVVDEGAGTIWFGDVADNPISEEPLTNTMADARRIHNFYSDEPIDDVIPDWGNVDYMTGTLRGHNNVFKLADSTLDTQSSDEYYSEYIYTWEANILDLDAYPELSETFNMPDTTLEKNTLRPNEEIKLFAIPSGPAYGFINYTYIDASNEEVELPFIERTPPVRPLDYYNGPVTIHQVKFPYQYTGEEINYPSAVMQIYANYVVALFGIRNYNAWKDSNEQSIEYRLRYGYGLVKTGIIDDILDDSPNTKEFPLATEIKLRFQITGGGYELGESFWWPGSGATLDFDQEVLDTLDNSSGNSNITYLLEYDEEGSNSNQVEQTILTQDNLTYIGHRFKQLGTYIKITQAEDSANFTIDVEPNNSDIIREKSFSLEIDAPMYQIGGDELTWFIGHQPGQSQLPVIQNITYWDDNTNQLITTNNPSEIGITLDQQGNVQLGSPEPNQVVLHYSTPNSNESDNYYKYININMFSEIILQPFLGVFEIDFSSNSENLGTISFLEQAPEIPQTTIIGLFGNENARETPTHAIDMDTWHDGDTSGIIPIPLDIDINAVDTQLGTLTTTLAPNFETRVDQILENSNFDNYDAGFKMAIKNALNNYLNIQITDDNSFSIEPSTTNEAVREVLTFVEQNNDVPRLPLRITGFFVQMFTLTINSFPVFNNENSYPTKFITNWNQAAYDENSSITAADTWLLDDSILEIPFTSMSDSDELQIPPIPPAFFNGERELKIEQAISFRSEADEGVCAKSSLFKYDIANSLKI